MLGVEGFKSKTDSLLCFLPKAHPVMHLANPKWNCTDQKEEHFIDGITNGASWSSLSGGMQDYNYVHSNCFEITLELGCDRFPKGTELEKYWHDNKKALVELTQQVCYFLLFC